MASSNTAKITLTDKELQEIKPWISEKILKIVKFEEETLFLVVSVAIDCVEKNLDTAKVKEYLKPYLDESTDEFVKKLESKVLKLKEEKLKKQQQKEKEKKEKRKHSTIELFEKEDDEPTDKHHRDKRQKGENERDRDREKRHDRDKEHKDHGDKKHGDKDREKSSSRDAKSERSKEKHLPPSSTPVPSQAPGIDKLTLAQEAAEKLRKAGELQKQLEEKIKKYSNIK